MSGRERVAREIAEAIARHDTDDVLDLRFGGDGDLGEFLIEAIIGAYDELLALLAERQGPVGEIGYIVITHKPDSRGEEKEAEVHLRADAEEKVLALPLGVHPLYFAPQPSVERDHMAMEVLRERCRAGGEGGWSLWGSSLMYARIDQRKTLSSLREFYDDPADAILATLEADQEGENGGAP